MDKELIAKWNKDAGGSDSREVIFLQFLRGEGLDDKQISAVLHVMDSVCHECWDARTGCQCWNDE